jgi:hypothetical protein
MRGRQTEAATPACDDCYLACQPEIHVPLEPLNPLND